MDRQKYGWKKTTFVKRVLAIILSFSMIFGIAAVAEPMEVWAMTTQSAAVQWARSQAGKSLDWDGKYGAQCMDLIAYYCQYLGVSPVLASYAKDYASKNPPAGWQRIQGASIQAGDVVIWTGGEYGHVAIAISGDRIIEQNYNSHKYCEENPMRWNNSYWGVWRPNFNPEASQNSFISYMKTPASGGNYSGSITILGYALHKNGIRNVTAWVNGQVMDCPMYNSPDVAQVYPGYPTGNEGFNAQIPVSYLKEGENKIDIYAYEKDDTPHLIASHKFNWKSSYMKTGNERVISDGDYHIVSALEADRINFGKHCLAIDGIPDNKNKHANAIIRPVFGMDDSIQKDYVFTVTWMGDNEANGFYKIALKNSDNMCLDVLNADTARGANVWQYDCNGSAAQQWCIKQTDDGNGYTLQARCSGYYLDVEDGSTSDGANVRLWDGNNTDAQRWYFVPWVESETAKQEIADGEYQIVTQISPDKALGNNILLTSARDNKKHTFNVKWLGNGYYEIANKNSGLMLDINLGLHKNGANVQLCGNNGGNNQKWIIRSCGKSCFNIISKLNGSYLDDSSSEAKDGASVHMWAGHGGDNQKWHFVPWGDSIGRTVEDGEYRIISQADESKILSANDAVQTTDGNGIELNSNNNDVRQIFDIKHIGSGYYGIINKSSGLALDAVDNESKNGSNAQLCEENLQDEQKWMLKSNEDGSYHIISSRRGLYLDAKSETLEDGTHVYLWNQDGSTNQNWKLVPCNQTVNVESIHLEQGELTMSVGSQETLKAVFNPQDATDKTLTWKSSNPSVAEVDVNGQVMAKTPGIAVVIATTSNGKTDFCQVTVTKENQPFTHTHSYGTEWKIDNENHWKECTCGDKSEEKGHEFTWIIDKAATAENIGIKHEECGICGYKRNEGTVIEKLQACHHVYQTTKIPATEKKNGIIAETCNKCGNEKSRTVIHAADSVTLSQTSYVYNGKTKKPSVMVKDSSGKMLRDKTDYSVSYSGKTKNVGSYTVTITLKGNYSGMVKKTFDIVPKGTSISKMTAQKKGFSIKWKKQTKQTSGYEIACSTSSKFVKKHTKTVTVKKNKITSKSISKLKAKKKYYIRIRTYKTVRKNGKSAKFYSAWSKAKTVTTKK